MAVTISGSGQIVKQIVQAVKTDAWSSTSTSAVDVTGLSVSITPTSASNKILVSFDVPMSGGDTGQRIRLWLVRDGTAIYIGDAAGSESRVAYMTTVNSGAMMLNGTGTFLDSPNTTSTVTYKIQAACESGAGVQINRTLSDVTSNNTYGRAASNITVMEIAYA